jgi:hypothetical protein
MVLARHVNKNQGAAAPVICKRRCSSSLSDEESAGVWCLILSRWVRCHGPAYWQGAPVSAGPGPLSRHVRAHHDRLNVDQWGIGRALVGPNAKSQRIPGRRVPARRLMSWSRAALALLRCAAARRHISVASASLKITPAAATGSYLTIAYHHTRALLYPDMCGGPREYSSARSRARCVVMLAGGARCRGPAKIQLGPKLEI